MNQLDFMRVHNRHIWAIFEMRNLVLLNSMGESFRSVINLSVSCTRLLYKVSYIFFFLSYHKSSKTDAAPVGFNPDIL